MLFWLKELVQLINKLYASALEQIYKKFKAIGSDSRIGAKFLSTGPGFGGRAKKDILNLIYLCNSYGLNEVSNYWESVLK